MSFSSTLHACVEDLDKTVHALLIAARRCDELDEVTVVVLLNRSMYPGLTSIW